jgi:hypothetical protein
MSDRDDKKRNEDDLAEIRSLIGVRSLFPQKRSGSQRDLTCPGRRLPAPPGVRGR